MEIDSQVLSARFSTVHCQISLVIQSSKIYLCSAFQDTHFSVALQKIMMLIFVILTSCLMFAFSRLELNDNIVTFCDGTSNQIVEICYLVYSAQHK